MIGYLNNSWNSYCNFRDMQYVLSKSVHNRNNTIQNTFFFKISMALNQGENLSQNKNYILSHTLSSQFSVCRDASWSADVKAGVLLSRSFSARVFSTIFLSTATAFSSCSGVRPLSPIYHSISFINHQSSCHQNDIF